MRTIAFVAPGSNDFFFSDDWSYLVYELQSGINQPQQLLLTNVQTGATQTVATAPGNDNGSIFDINTQASIISQDGLFVAYSIQSFDGTAQPQPTVTSTFKLFDQTTGVTQTVYSDTEAATHSGQGTAGIVALSPDDQSLFFTSDYSDLGQIEGSFGLFDLNLQTGTIHQVLTGLASLDPDQSPGGTYIVVEAGGYNFYRVDTTTGNVDPILAITGVSGDDTTVSLSEDGRLAVISTEQRLLPQDTNDVDDIYLKDLSTGELTLLSTTASGELGNGDSSRGLISADGSRIVFETTASNLSPGASATDPHIVSMDLATGAIGLLWDDTTGHAKFKVSPDGETLALDTTEHLTAAGAAYTQGIYTIHFTLPKLTINTIASDNLVSLADGPTITISGTSDAIGQVVNITLPGSGPLGTATVHSDGTWSTSVDASSLADGAYDVRAFVTDGLTTHVDESIAVDRTPPQLTFTSVAGDDVIDATELSHATIIGSLLVADPTGPGIVPGTLTIGIDGSPSKPFLTTDAGPALVADNFSKNFDASGLADGQHTFTLTAIDEAGNTVSKTLNVLVDTTPPKIAITSVSGDDVVDSSEMKTEQGVHGTSNAIGQTVDVLIDGVEAGQAVVQQDGTWLTTVSFADTATGNHDVTAEVADRAGYTGQADAAVYVDTGFAVTQLSAGPTGAQGGGQGVLFPGLSADGTKLVFTGLNFDLMSTATGSSGAQVYIKDLTTGAISFATPDASENAEFGAISQDGRYVTFVSNAILDPVQVAPPGNPLGGTPAGALPGTYYTFTEDLTTGVPYLHAFDSTDPDTLEPGVPSDGYLEPWQLGLPFAPLPVFPLAISDAGIALKLWERTDAFQTDAPLVLNTQIMVDYSYGADGTSNGPDDEVLLLGLLGVDALPNDFRFQTYAPQISADGSVVAYELQVTPEQLDNSTYPATISSLGPAFPTQIYAVHATNADWQTGPISFSVASSFADGTPLPFGAIDPALSADGRFIAFWSWDNADKPQVYVKNLTTGELKIASSDALGNPGVKNASGTFNAGFNTIAISADGRYVAFTSDAKLTSDDSGTGADLFVKDMQTGAIQRVPLPAGTFANDLSAQLTMTANGQYIAFTTSAGLAAMDSNHVADVYGISLAALGTPPQIAIKAVAGDDRINQVEDTKHVTVSGTSDAIGRTVTLYVDGGFLPGVVVGSDGTWSTTIDATGLIDGVHQLRATVSNTNGATGTDGDLVTVDTIGPIVHLSADKSHLAAGQTATVTASFSEGIGNIASNFLTASGGTLGQISFVDDHTLTAVFTASASTYSITAHPLDAFDFAGNSNVSGASLTNAKGFDGYLSGSFVFADANTNGSFDPGEASTTTDGSGNFTLSGSGPLILTGGTDISTGLPFTGTLKAPDGSAVVSPLATLVEKLVESGDTVTQANDAVTAALGLPAGIDLTTLDAVAGTLSGDAASTAAFKAGSELLDAITLIQAAGGSTDAAYAALAADVAAGSIINLADEATIKAIGQSAGLDVAAAQTVASIASETSAALETQLAHAATPFEIFVDITGASIAEQGDAASALSLAGNDAAYQQVAANYFQNLGTTLNHDDLIAAGNVACYGRGTLILTDNGEIPVEKLAIGDQVVTASGAARPIKWIGQRAYGGRFLIGQKHILPVCIKAGALEANTPRRDLWISPHHAMYLEGVLIEARDLVNGTNILQPDDTADVEYFHIELDGHDVIVAEGALSETFVDDDSRGMFHNLGEYHALYPDETAGPATYCAPRCADGYTVEAARRNIAQRAGLRTATIDEGAGKLRGYVDLISPTRIEGWAQNEQHPEAPVCLDIIIDGECIDQVLANRYREDLCRAGLGSGNHSFSYVARPERPIGAGLVEIRRSLDGAPLAASAQCQNYGSYGPELRELRCLAYGS